LIEQFLSAHNIIISRFLTDFTMVKIFIMNDKKSMLGVTLLVQIEMIIVLDPLFNLRTFPEVADITPSIKSLKLYFASSNSQEEAALEQLHRQHEQVPDILNTYLIRNQFLRRLWIVFTPSADIIIVAAQKTDSNSHLVPFVTGQFDDLANLQQVVVNVNWPDVDKLVTMISNIAKGKSIVNLAEPVRKNFSFLDGAAVTRAKSRHGF